MFANSKNSFVSPSNLGSDSPVKSKVDKVDNEKPNIDRYLEDARFFIMKSSNYENVSLSKAKVRN